jgi:hypothetical protein
LAVPGDFKNYPQCNGWPVEFAKQIAAQLRTKGIAAEYKADWAPTQLSTILKDHPSVQYDAYLIVTIDRILLQSILFVKSPSGADIQRVVIKNGRDLSDIAEIPVSMMSGLIGGHGAEKAATQFVEGTIDQNRQLHNPVGK